MTVAELAVLLFAIFPCFYWLSAITVNTQ